MDLSFSEELNKEILSRIELMESPDYQYPPRFRKNDWIGFGLVLAACLIGVVGVVIYSGAM